MPGEVAHVDRILLTSKYLRMSNNVSSYTLILCFNFINDVFLSVWSHCMQVVEGEETYKVKE